MNIQTKRFDRCQTKSSITTMITVDDDYIVKDTKPDVVKVIYAGGYAVPEETRVNKDAIWITGKLLVTLVYQSDRENAGLEALTSEIPFQEKLNVEDVDETDEVPVRIQKEDINVSIINSRKLSIRALLGVKAFPCKKEQIQLTRDVEEKVEKRVAKEELLFPYCIVNRKEKMHIRLELPSNKPNFGRIISVIPTLTVKGGVFHISVGVVYENQTEGISWHTFEEELEKRLDEYSTEKEDILWLEAGLEQFQTEVMEDFDGECRCLSCEAVVLIQGQIYKEEEVEHLLDLYSLDKNLEVTEEKIRAMRFLMKNVAKTRVCQRLELEAYRQRMLSVCTYGGEVELDSAKPDAGGIMIEGVLKTELMYMTNQDNLPLSSVSGQIAFKQYVEIKNMKESTKCDILLSLESLQMNLMDQGTYEVLASVNVAVIAYEEDEITNIVEITETEMPKEEKEPGMIGYTAKPGESLWDIAKKYKCTVEDIIQTNELVNDEIRGEQKLLIVKFYK